MITKALIPAAGRGIRAYPKTQYLPKPLLEIDGKTLLQRNIETLRDELGIHDITVIVGYEGEQIMNRFGSGASLNVSLRYLKCDDPDIGLARGMLLAEEVLQEPFVTILGDELYHQSNHQKLLAEFDSTTKAICAVLQTRDMHQIKKNYSLKLNAQHIVSLIEKPTVIENNLLGCGTFVFTPEIFSAIKSTPVSARSGRIELIDTINTLAAQADCVRPFYLTGKYFNINTVDDYNYAQYKVRAERFEQCKVSVVIPAYNEEESIAFVVEDFRDLVDEVLVVNNSSGDNTAKVAAAAGARVETAKLTGYGDTIRYGLDRAIGDRCRRARKDIYSATVAVVSRQRAIIESEHPGILNATATRRPGALATCNCELGDRDGARGNIENAELRRAARVVPLNDDFRARAVDRQVLVDRQFRARQRDRCHAGGGIVAGIRRRNLENNCVSGRRILDRLSQRAGGVIVGIYDVEDGRMRASHEAKENGDPEK